MKTIIAFASKTGTTEKCARRLAGILDDAKIVDLTKETPTITSYDLIVVGGSIRMGTLHKSAKEFIEANQDQLERKKIAFFICNGFLDQAAEALEKNIPSALRKKALAVASFGGELDVTKQKGMDKMMLKLASKSEAAKRNPKPRILEDRIKEFAAKLQS